VASLKKGKIVLGIITNQPTLLKEVEELLKPEWGEIELKSEMMNFDFTDYYEKEFGKGLLRLWESFERIVEEDRLVDLKMLTNDLERQFLKDGKRRINLDPGILTLSKYILATKKDYSHRIYIRNGIYAEVTLIYKNKSFHPLEWTYPDYRKPEAIEFFNKVRELLKLQLKRGSRLLL